MIKKPLFLIMMLMVSLPAVSAQVLKTREDFVHYPDHYKKQIIIDTMKLMVELENRYERETKKYGLSPKRLEQFQKIVRMISEGVISSAKAQEAFNASADWKTLAANFQSVKSSEGSDKCVFGGWISTTYRSGNKIYCRHPARNERVSSGHPAPKEGASCNTGNQIQCNPLIFGYKNLSAGSTFCVSTNDFAKNSSFQCMNKALEENPEEGADSVETRLNFLTKSLEEHPEVFNHVQKYIYQACLCPTQPQGFNTPYRNAINNHRTCYGLMRTIARVGVSCELPTKIFPSEQAQAYQSVFNELQNKLEGEEAVMDQNWRRFRQNLSQTNEFKRTCGEEVPGPPERQYICESYTCSPEADETDQCQYVVKVEGSDTTIEFSTPPSSDGAKEGSSFTITFREKEQSHNGQATCQRQSPPVPQLMCISATCTSSAATPAASEEDESDTSYDVPQAADQTPSAISCTLSVQNAQGKEVPTTHTPPDFKETEDGQFKKTFSVTDDENSTPQDLLCPTSLTTSRADPPTGEDDEPDPTQEPTLEVSIKNAGKTHYLVEAVYTNAPGWSFSWRSEKNEAPISVVDSDSEITENLAGDDNSVAESSSGSSQTNQKRLESDYKVYGVLTKEGETTIEREATIAKVITSQQQNRRPLPTVNPNLRSGQQMMIRGTSDTAAGGIR